MLVSSVLQIIQMYFYQPINDIVLYDCGTSAPLFYAVILIQSLGFYYFLQTMWDLLYCDVFGFDHYRHFKRQGTEFPMPFTMKSMSRVAFSCRHPLMTFFYLVLFTCIGYGKVTLGRFFFIVAELLGITIGLNFEDRELRRHVGKQYLDFCKMVPNWVIPDLSLLFVGSLRLE